MVSQRKRKKEAERQGLNCSELQMLEMLEEILERFRWLQVLAHTQSFLLREKLKISEEELDRVLEAATRTVDKDAAWQGWQKGLGKLKGSILEARRGIRRERKHMRREKVQAKTRARPSANEGSLGGSAE